MRHAWVAAMSTPSPRSRLFTLATEAARPARPGGVQRLIEMADGWVAAKTRTGGLKAVKEGARPKYGKEAERVLRGGGGGGRQQQQQQQGGPSKEDIRRLETQGLNEEEAANLDRAVESFSWKEAHSAIEHLSAEADPRAVKVLARHLKVSDKGTRKQVAARVTKAILKKKAEKVRAEHGERAEAEVKKGTPKDFKSFARDLDAAIEEGRHEEIAATAAALGIVPHASAEKNRTAILNRVKQLRRQPRQKKAEPKPSPQKPARSAQKTPAAPATVAEADQVVRQTARRAGLGSLLDRRGVPATGDADHDTAAMLKDLQNLDVEIFDPITREHPGTLTNNENIRHAYGAWQEYLDAKKQGDPYGNRAARVIRTLAATRDKAKQQYAPALRGLAKRGVTTLGGKPVDLNAAADLYDQHAAGLYDRLIDQAAAPHAERVRKGEAKLADLPPDLRPHVERLLTQPAAPATAS